MPDTYGKRERRKVQERKAAARDERRIARNRRRHGLPGDVPPRSPFGTDLGEPEEPSPSQ